MRRREGRRMFRSTVRWSASEWGCIRRRAARCGLKPSSYIRAVSLGDSRELASAPRTGRTRFAEPRSVAKRIRFHPEEWQRIERLAKTLGLPPIRFIREAAVGYRISTRIDDEAVRQLARVGGNLNQLARVANASGHIADAAALRETLDEIHAALDRLL